MDKNTAVKEREQIAQIKQRYLIARDTLAAFDQIRAVCPGYDLDIFNEEYRRVCRQYAQAHQQLAEVADEGEMNCIGQFLIRWISKNLACLMATWRSKINISRVTKGGQS